MDIGHRTKDIGRWTIVGITCAAMLYLVVLALLKKPIWCDSSFYLCYVNRIAEGYVLFKDISLSYTPLWFYLMAGIKVIFHLPDVCFEVWLAINFLFQFITVFFLYKIYRIWKLERLPAFLAAALYFFLSYWAQGNDVLLETPCVTFGVAAIYAFYQYGDKHPAHLIWIGALAMCSMLVKQFGVGFVGLILLLCLTRRREDAKIRAILYVLLGAMIPIVLCYACFGTAFNKMLLPSYGAIGQGNGLGITVIDRLLYCKAHLVGLFWSHNLIALFPFVLIFFPQNRQYWRELLFVTVGLLGFLMTDFFRLSGGMEVHYWRLMPRHYELLCMPFVSGLVALAMKMGHRTLDIRHRTIDIGGLVMWAFLIAMFVENGKAINKHIIRYEYNRAAEQMTKRDYVETAKIITEIVNDENAVLWANLYGIEFYYLTNLLPPNIQKRGYAFGPQGLTEEDCARNIAQSDWVIDRCFDSITEIREPLYHESYFTKELQQEVRKHKGVRLPCRSLVLYDMKSND